MFQNYNYSSRLIILLAMLMPLPSVAGSGELLVEDPRIMQPPPGARVAAGFMLLVNPGAADVILTGASSEAFGHIEIHESVVENDVAKMIKQSELVIPAGESVELKHGSYHLMLMNFKAPLEADQEIPVMLETSSGSLAVVLKVIGPGKMSHGKMSHGDMANEETAEDKKMHDMSGQDGDKPKDAN